MGFLISWSPYAIVSIYRVFTDDYISPMVETIPAMFAKSTLLWTSVLYIYSNRKIRVIIKNYFFEKKEKIKKQPIFL